MNSFFQTVIILDKPSRRYIVFRGDYPVFTNNEESARMDKARILVIGGGVNGSAIAAGLFSGGVDVTILARGKRFDELRAGGIIIENPFNQKRTVTRVPVIDRLGPDELYDYILVVVRKNQVASLLPLLADNRSPNIVFMGNNLSGPGEFVKALGKERVMMAGVYAAGKRDGELIRAIVFKSAGSPCGEINGRITPRLIRLADIFGQAGCKMELSHNIVDFQMTHGVGVALIATLALKHGGKVRNLARATDDLKLFVAARREGQQVLHSLGHQVLPKSEVVITKIPAFLQVAAMRILLSTKFGVVGLEYHLSQAPDEMDQLVGEFRELVDQAGIPVPAIRKVLGELS
jgi:2-dehydropantoate 2-reductase